MSSKPIPINGVNDRMERSWHLPVWLSRAFMFPPMMILSLLTVRHLTNPGGAITGVALKTPEAFTNTRVLGAWILTLLVMQIIFVSSPRRFWLGHLQLAAFMGFTLVTRVFGFLNDGTTLAMGNQRIITIVETVFLILNLIGLTSQNGER